MVRNYLDWLAVDPLGQGQDQARSSVVRAEQILEEDHYGLEKVKERILEPTWPCRPAPAR